MGLLSPEETRLASELARHYRLDELRPGPREAEVGSKGLEQKEEEEENKKFRMEGMNNQRGIIEKQDDGRLSELPRPTNVTVLIISWYPPILKLSWTLNELSVNEANKLDFYEKVSAINSNSQSANNQSDASPSSDDFDLDLALAPDPDASSSSSSAVVASLPSPPSSPMVDKEKSVISELRKRRLLIRKSLTCFQVTYNVIDSR